VSPSPLSNVDLGVFFEERHHALASSLEPIELEDDLECARAMGKSGLFEHLVPDAGADVRTLVLIREHLGYYSAMADSIFAVQGLGSYPILLAGNDDQRALLPKFRAGEYIGAFGLTEPEAGSDVASMQTTAVRDGDSFVLNGAKTLISNAGIATHYTVFANADPDKGRKGISAFIVEAGTPGFEVEPMEVIATHPIGALRFENCRVPATALLGELGGGFRLAMQTLDTFRVTVGAAAVGMARRAFDDALERVSTRTQFGKPLAEQQLVQGHLADMSTELDAARMLVLRAAYEKDQGKARVTLEAAKAKLFATEAAQRIIDRAVQLFGGLGVVRGTAVEELYRAIRPLRIYEGTSEIQRLIIGRGVVKQLAEEKRG